MECLAVVCDCAWAEVRQSCCAPQTFALAAGCGSIQLIWDPGLGFAQKHRAEPALLRGLAEARREGVSPACGPSRKTASSERAQRNQARPACGHGGRLPRRSRCGTDVLRVHDVGPIVQTPGMIDAIVRPPLR